MSRNDSSKQLVTDSEVYVVTSLVIENAWSPNSVNSVDIPMGQYRAKPFEKSLGGCRD